jgi:hypothetical protein
MTVYRTVDPAAAWLFVIEVGVPGSANHCELGVAVGANGSAQISR